jgi:hypothetical protein
MVMLCDHFSLFHDHAIAFRRNQTLIKVLEGISLIVIVRPDYKGVYGKGNSVGMQVITSLVGGPSSCHAHKEVDTLHSKLN